jgi:phosphonate degradation associated HDIG domain protein
MRITLTDIVDLLETKGHRRYAGEPVTHVEHALQTAFLAEEAGADPWLITAALLHDIGHLVNDLGESPTRVGRDDWHQTAARRFMTEVFDDGVLQPIFLHVDAKRFLCATRPGYRETLSEDSRRSLDLQGGAFTPAEASAFLALPFAHRAAQLRVWDDLAKAPGRRTPPLSHFLVYARAVVLPSARAAATATDAVSAR